MRRQMQKGSLRKANGRWFAQWREEGNSRKRVLGSTAQMGRGQEEALLAPIVRPLDEGRLGISACTKFREFVEQAYLPFYSRKWKRTTL